MSQVSSYKDQKYVIHCIISGCGMDDLDFYFSWQRKQKRNHILWQQSIMNFIISGFVLDDKELFQWGKKKYYHIFQ